MESMVASHSSDGFHPRSGNIKFLPKGEDDIYEDYHFYLSSTDLVYLQQKTL